MKSFLLQFAETPQIESLPVSELEYSRTLNLTVIKGTDVPAINVNELATETFTKANSEGTDPDVDFQRRLSVLMATSTQTRVYNETPDDDKGLNELQYLLDTRTLTESSETTDSDQ